MRHSLVYLVLGILIVLSSGIQAGWPPNPNGGTVQFVVSQYEKNEGGGNALITVQRINGTNGYFEVDYATLNGTAAAGSDYTYRSGKLYWLHGESGTKQISVPISNDSIDELDETFTLILSNPTHGVALGSQSIATVVIQASDPKVEFLTSIASVDESDTNVTVGLQLSHYSGDNIVVPISYAGNATKRGITELVSNGDIEVDTTNWLLNQSSPIGGGSFFRSSAEKFFSSRGIWFDLPTFGTWLIPSYSIYADVGVGGFDTNATYTLSFYARSNSDKTVELHIRDGNNSNQVANFGSINLKPFWQKYQYQFTPQQTGNYAQLRWMLTSDDVPMNLGIDGLSLVKSSTASDDWDYSSSLGSDSSITFTPGQTSKNITLGIREDQKGETSEVAQLNIVSQGLSGASVGVKSTFGATIVNDDLPPVTVPWSPYVSVEPSEAFLLNVSSSFDPDHHGIVRYEWDFDYDNEYFNIDFTTTVPELQSSSTVEGIHRVGVRSIDRSGLLSEVVNGHVYVTPSTLFAQYQSNSLMFSRIDADTIKVDWSTDNPTTGTLAYDSDLGMNQPITLNSSAMGTEHSITLSNFPSNKNICINVQAQESGSSEPYTVGSQEVKNSSFLRLLFYVDARNGVNPGDVFDGQDTALPVIPNPGNGTRERPWRTISYAISQIPIRSGANTDTDILAAWGEYNERVVVDGSVGYGGIGIYGGLDPESWLLDEGGRESILNVDGIVTNKSFVTTDAIQNSAVYLINNNTRPVELDNFTIYGGESNSDINSVAGIRAINNQAAMFITNNKIYGFIGPGGISGTGNNTGVGMFICENNNAYVSNNRILRCQTGAELAYTYCNFHNNTIDSKWSTRAGIGVKFRALNLYSDYQNFVIGYSTPVFAMNNIIVGTNHAFYDSDSNSYDLFTIDYNNLHNNNSNYYQTIAAPNDTYNLPQFVNQSSSNYTLASGSPCIDAGDPNSNSPVILGLSSFDVFFPPSKGGVRVDQGYTGGIFTNKPRLPVFPTVTDIEPGLTSVGMKWTNPTDSRFFKTIVIRVAAGQDQPSIQSFFLSQDIYPLISPGSSVAGGTLIYVGNGQQFTDTYSIEANKTYCYFFYSLLHMGTQVGPVSNTYIYASSDPYIVDARAGEGIHLTVNKDNGVRTINSNSSPNLFGYNGGFDPDDLGRDFYIRYVSSVDLGPYLEAKYGGLTYNVSKIAAKNLRATSDQQPPIYFVGPIPVKANADDIMSANPNNTTEMTEACVYDATPISEGANYRDDGTEFWLNFRNDLLPQPPPGNRKLRGITYDHPTNAALKASIDLILAGGVEIDEVKLNQLNPQPIQIDSTFILHRNPADALYISGHGSHAKATIAGIDPKNPLHAAQISKWREDVELVVITGCSVLDVKNYSGEWGMFTTGASPGEVWDNLLNFDAAGIFSFKVTMLGSYHSALSGRKALIDFLFAEWQNSQIGLYPIETAWYRANNSFAQSGAQICTIESTRYRYLELGFISNTIRTKTRLANGHFP